MTCPTCPPAPPPDPREKHRAGARIPSQRRPRKELPVTGYHKPDTPANSSDLRPLSVEELADLTGWTRRQCWDLARRGELPVIRVGRRLYFPRPAILALLAAGNGAPVRSEEAASA